MDDQLEPLEHFFRIAKTEVQIQDDFVGLRLWHWVAHPGPPPKPMPQQVAGPWLQVPPAHLQDLIGHLQKAQLNLAKGSPGTPPPDPVH